MFNTIFWTIVIILIASHLSGLYLDMLNIRMWTDELPEKLRNVINHDDYRKSQLYYRANRKFGNITSTVNLVIILSFLALGGFSFVDDFLRVYISNELLVSLLFFATIGLLANIISIPFAWYGTFVIEEDFGFNRTSKLTFFVDIFKGWLVSLLIGGPVILLVIWIYYRSGDMFWIFVWIVVTLFSLFMNMFYSNLIVPLFNKQRPLEPGPLRDGIEKMASQAGFRLSDIYTIDGSKRSTRSNAYFAGLGPKKRIVLYDTLLNDLEEEEVIAVLAHEIGHFRKRHSTYTMIAGIFQTGLLLFIFSLLAHNNMLAEALGSSRSSFHLSLIAFILIYSPVSLLLSIVMNYISRRHEFSADRFAMELYNGAALSSALKKLSVKNLSNLNPHPAFVFFYYSHPPLLERLKRLE